MIPSIPYNPKDDDENIIYNRRPRKKSRAQRERDQALADWFQALPELNEKSGMHSLNILINEVVARMPFEVTQHDPEILRKAWREVAGDFICQNAELVSVVKGVATIRVLQPAMRYHLKQWEHALLEKLRAKFGSEHVKTIRIIFG